MINQKSEIVDFGEKTLNSFRLMRDDVDRFRESMNDWILFLDGELREAKETVADLSKRIEELEMRERIRF